MLCDSFILFALFYFSFGVVDIFLLVLNLSSCHLDPILNIFLTFFPEFQIMFMPGTTNTILITFLIAFLLSFSCIFASALNISH